MMMHFFLQNNSDAVLETLHRLLLSSYGIIGLATILALLLTVLIAKLNTLLQAQHELLRANPPKGKA